SRRSWGPVGVQRRSGRLSTLSHRKAGGADRTSRSRSWQTLQSAAQNVGDRLSLAGSRRTRGGGGYRVLRQSQHLVERFLVGDEIGLHQLLAGGRQLKRIHFQMLADGAVGVVAQPLGVGDRDQEQIQSPSTVVGAGKVIVADQPMVNPTEAGGNLAQPLR